MKYFYNFLSGAAWAIGFLSMISLVHAANTGLFGDIIAKILGIPVNQVATYAGDGTVANSAKLGGMPANKFQQVAPSQSCGAGKCIYGFDPSGNVLCR